MTWVEDHLGLRLHTGTRSAGVDLDDVVGLALRRNPRRAHLLVSRLLAKHIPSDPRLVHAGGRLLGGLVDDVLHDRPANASRHGGLLLAALAGDDAAAVAVRDAVLAEQEDAALAEQEQGGDTDDAAADAVAPVVLGYAETATALGHCVGDALPGSTYLHSTRRQVAGVPVAAEFEEPHSHATSHLLLPRDPALLRSSGALVLVDDELSTGTTALGTIRALHAISPRERYVVAALVDLRPDDARADMADAVAALGARLDVVSLVSGTVDLPAGVLAAGARLVEQLDRAGPVGEGTPSLPAATLTRVELAWPPDLAEGARHGFGPTDRGRWREELADVARGLDHEAAGSRPPSGQRVLFLGTEELMAAPLRLAEAYADAHPDLVVRFSTTTRSPAVALDDAGYALRSALSFPAHDEPMDAVPGAPGARYAYNVGAGFDRVVLVTDSPADSPALMAPDGLVDRLRRVTRAVHLVVLPAVVPPAPVPAQLSTPRPGLPAPLHGPQFGSYAADEVSWLLTDLSHVQLEAPTQDREAAIQSGRAHYAESLPVEYQPDAAYQSLFHTAVDESARRIAHAVGVVAEILRAERGGSMVLASLARAGTPIGILVRRWLAHRHGVSPAHYTLSIVRGRGIDSVALEYLAAHHDPRDVVFVDGWTGKGAIARELTAAVERHNASHATAFDPQMAVLADPGRCVRVFGTRDDFLIPSACLNSTVSGLVSRTVLNEALIGPGDFHGAKFYSELAGGDVSNLYLDAVTACFDDVRGDVDRDWPAVAAGDRTPTWEGWAAVERIAREYGIGEVNLVKPGVGETTRVLLRRVPQRVLVRADAAAALPHVLLLARQRGVPVELVHGLPYTCVGLIEPHTGGEG